MNDVNQSKRITGSRISMMSQNTSHDLTLPYAPAIPGLHFRSFRGDNDLPIILQLINACKVADLDERSDTLADVQRNYSHLVNCDPAQDMLFAEVDGEPVAYCRLYWYQVKQENARIYTGVGFLRPEWRGKGLGHAILRWSEDRQALIASGHPADSQRFYEGFASGAETSKVALLEEMGYAPIRRFYVMVRPDLENIPEAPLPQGIEVRPVQADHYRMIWNAMQEAFADHWGFSPGSEEDYFNWQESPSFQPDLWQIAWDDNQVVGTVLAFIDYGGNHNYHRLRGWTEEISVRRPWRKCGIAKALLCRSLRDLKQHGMTEAALGVDTENLSGALRLYESVGFRPVKISALYRKAIPD
jgi:mycothiol synthase